MPCHHGNTRCLVGPGLDGSDEVLLSLTFLCFVENCAKTLVMFSITALIVVPALFGGYCIYKEHRGEDLFVSKKSWKRRVLKLKKEWFINILII